jgi:regulation of enolase protein 1 (concanavalin A-like superfamily)
LRHDGRIQAIQVTASVSAIQGDFAAQVRVRGSFHALDDQAGLMVRVDESRRRIHRQPS